MSLLMLPKIFRPKCRNYILHMDYILHNQITYGILLSCPCKMQILPKNFFSFFSIGVNIIINQRSQKILNIFSKLNATKFYVI